MLQIVAANAIKRGSPATKMGGGQRAPDTRGKAVDQVSLKAVNRHLFPVLATEKIIVIAKEGHRSGSLQSPAAPAL